MINYCSVARSELSGGQAQRVAIARALITNPSVLICDEPVSALDASLRAQVLDLLVELRRARGLSLLFVTHDLSAARYVCEHTLVLRKGRSWSRERPRQLLEPATAPVHARVAGLHADG